jgi:hypothetical protein
VPPKVIALDVSDSLADRVEHDLVMQLQWLVEPREVEHDDAIWHVTVLHLRADRDGR